MKRTEREWYAIVPVAFIPVGNTWDGYSSAGADHVHVSQIAQHEQLWTVFYLEQGKKVMQQWHREWPVRPDPLRVAVAEAIQRSQCENSSDQQA